MSNDPNPAPSRIIPNAFQKPNWIADVVMRYLPGEHYKCLEVVLRKTLGFWKERDRISRSQIVAMTGLNVKTVDKCMRDLCVFGLVIKTAGNNAKNHGNEYEMQLDDRLVNLSALMAWSGNKRITHTRKLPVQGVSPRGGSTTTRRGEGVPTRWETQKPISKANRSSHTTGEIEFSEMTVEQAYKVPSLAMYRKATGFFPGKMVWAFVDGFVREHGITENQLKAAAEAWARRGHKQSNVEGILEWARDGIPAQRKPTQPKGKKRADGSDPIENILGGSNGEQ
jgi:phage replication O-like protein O